MTNLQNNHPEVWRPVPAACFAQFVAPVLRAPSQCAKPFPSKVSRTLHAAYSRTGPREALADRRYSACATASGMRSNCANCAQQVLSSTRTVGKHSGPTGSGFALRFAPFYANLVRTRPAVTTGSYQCERLPGAGFHCGFQGFAVVSTGNLASCAQSPQRAARRIITSRSTHLRHGYSAMLNHHFANGGTSYGLE